MNWEEKYRSMSAPKSNPCNGCCSVADCNTICPARARWWDRQIRGEVKSPNEMAEDKTIWKKNGGERS